MKKISLILILGSFCGVGFAQPIALRFERLTTADGLPSHDLTAVIQDHLGFLWLGGPKGLIRYDGYEPVHYMPDPGDTTSISGAIVLFIYEDSTGDIWVGTDECIDRFDRETESFSCIVEVEEMPWFGRHRIVEGADGVMWAGTTQGLVSIDRESGTVLRRYAHQPEDATSLSGDDVRAVIEDSAGSLWVGAYGEGLNRFDRNENRFHFVPLEGANFDESSATARTSFPDRQVASSRNINDIVEGPDGALWIATDCGLYRIDSPGVPPYSVATSEAEASGNPCLSSIYLHLDKRKTLWINTDAGLFHYDPEKKELIRHHVANDEPIEVGLGSLIEDRSGIFWLAARSGLYKMNPTVQSFEIIESTETDSLHISSVYEDRMGLLWLGTKEGVLLQLYREKGIFSPYLSFPGSINNIDEDHSGALWIPVYGSGIFRLEPDRTTVTHFEQLLEDPGSLSSNSINRILVDRDGAVWVATWEGGLNRFNAQDSTFSHFVHIPGDPFSLPRNNIISIYEDRSGVLWLGLDKGLSRFDKESEQFRFFDIPSTLSMIEDSSGRFWAATIDGLYLVDRTGGATTAFRREDGLSHNITKSVQVDDNGHLWIGTDNGLSRFDPDSRSFTNYGTADGIASNLFSEDRGFKGNDGELFFGNEGKVTVFFPEQVPVNTKPPSVVFTGFRIRGEAVEIGRDSPLTQSISLTDHIRLPYKDRDFTISFAALHFERSELNRYSYMLEGYDESYSAPGFQRTANYTNLDPADYVFRVRAANRDGVWNEEGASITITVSLPWWRSKFAIVVYSMLLVAGLIVLERLHRKRLIRKERLQAVERELERAREIQAMNELLLQHEKQLEHQNAQLEAQKTQLQTQARQLQEVDRAKSRFFANISHEFRTPLTLILGPLENALRGAYGSALESIIEPLRGVHDQARRLLRLVNQLLDLAKLESGKMTLHAGRQDLIACLRDLVRSFAPAAERKRLTLHYQPEVPACNIVFDRDKLEKIVGNLLSNAIKFTPEGGKVWVTINDPSDASEYVAIVVRDTGSGIPREALSRLFDRFEQVDRPVQSHEGTGLGLALAKELVELHGGEIEVESEEGFGSSFIVRLPIVVQERLERREGDVEETHEASAATDFGQNELIPVAAESESRSEVSPSERHRSSILLVDDNTEVRTFIRSQLEPTYDIVEAADGDEALAQARSSRPNLVLSDVMMPGMDGFELCRRLKSDAALRHIPVVLLTARAGESDMVLGLDCGADDYLAKPFSTAELRARVAGLIRSRSELRSQFSREVVIKPSGVVGQAEDAAFLERTLAIIEANLEDSTFGVERLANEHGLSRRQLGRRIRLLTNKTPKALIWEMRIKRAADLLETRADTISEVAYKTGFKSPSHFSTAFRKVYGVSPSAFVKSSR